jgi:hypothetical protein
MDNVVVRLDKALCLGTLMTLDMDLAAQDRHSLQVP